MECIFLFETDSKTLFDALATNNARFTKFDDLVSQCRSFLLNRNNFVCSVVCSEATKQLLEHLYLTINLYRLICIY